MKKQLVHLIAVLTFSLAQIVTVAHAEGDHDNHVSIANCAVCCDAFSDKDIDGSPAIGVLAETLRLDADVCVPQSQTRVAEFDSYSLVRGPPYN